MSEAGHNNSGKQGLAWLYFLFGLVFAGGALYAALYHGFLKQTNIATYRSSIGQSVVVGTIDIVPQRNPKSIANGEASFKTCAACHGANLEGGVGPNLKDAEWLQVKEPLETEIYKVIMKGVAASEAKKAKAAMPKMGGLDNQLKVWEVVYYLSSQNAGIKKDAVPNQ